MPADDRDHENAHDPPHSEEPAKKSRGCFFWGCLGSVLLLLLIVVGVGLGGYFVLNSVVQTFTAEEPVELPVVEASEEELAEIEGRIDGLKQAFDQGKAPPPLELTADELNALVAHNDKLRGKVHFTIEDDKITGNVSIPTDFVPMGTGRFLNAKGTFNVSLQNGVLIVTLADAEVKGEPLPESFMTALANENLAQKFYSDPKNAEFMRQFESIEIEGDRIILRPRPVEEVADEAAGESDPPTSPGEPAGPE